MYNTMTFTRYEYLYTCIQNNEGCETFEYLAHSPYPANQLHNYIDRNRYYWYKCHYSDREIGDTHSYLQKQYIYHSHCLNSFSKQFFLFQWNTGEKKWLLMIIVCFKGNVTFVAILILPALCTMTNKGPIVVYTRAIILTRLVSCTLINI